MSGFIGSGDIYAERFVNGVSEGLLALGNATKIEIKENSEVKTRKSKLRASYGAALDTVVIKQPADVSLTLDDLDKDNLAMIFMGTVSDSSTTATTVTDEAHTVAKLDTMIALANGNVSTVTITGFVEGTDFEVVNAEAGFVKILSGGTVVAGDALAVSYSAGGTSGDLITGGVVPDVKMKLIMLGVNLVDQSSVRLEIPKATLTPQNGVDFLSEDFSTLELSGIATVPEGGTSAYKVEVNRKSL